MPGTTRTAWRTPTSARGRSARRFSSSRIDRSGRSRATGPMPHTTAAQATRTGADSWAALTGGITGRRGQSPAASFQDPGADDPVDGRRRRRLRVAKRYRGCGARGLDSRHGADTLERRPDRRSTAYFVVLSECAARKPLCLAFEGIARCASCIALTATREHSRDRGASSRR